MVLNAALDNEAIKWEIRKFANPQIYPFSAGPRSTKMNVCPHLSI